MTEHINIVNIQVKAIKYMKSQVFLNQRCIQRTFPTSTLDFNFYFLRREMTSNQMKLIAVFACLKKRRMRQKCFYHKTKLSGGHRTYFLSHGVRHCDSKSLSCENAIPNLVFDEDGRCCTEPETPLIDTKLRFLKKPCN